MYNQEYAVKDRWVVYRDNERVIVNERIAIAPYSLGYINPMMIDRESNTYIRQQEYTPEQFDKMFASQPPQHPGKQNDDAEEPCRHE